MVFDVANKQNSFSLYKVDRTTLLCSIECFRIILYVIEHQIIGYMGECTEKKLSSKPNLFFIRIINFPN